MDVTQETDGAVVRRVRAGDVEAFALLVDRHHARLARYALHLTGDRGEAEELVQETFVRAFRALGRYEDRERFGAWLLRILVNRCRSARARDARRAATASSWVAEAAEWSDPAERMALREELGAALARLPNEQREAVVLRYAEELGYEEIAALTGTGISALKMRVKRGCARLREILEASRARS
jgi:RNA polymerase sigma-70 factor (ECF subfamily)